MRQLAPLYISIFLLLFWSNSIAQTTIKIDSSYHNWYYQQRMELYNQIPPIKHNIVFLGNSITEKGEWQELLPEFTVANRGIGGDNTFGVLARLDNIIALQPEHLFICIGINDLGRGLPVETIVKNHNRIIQKLKNQLPQTKIYIQSILPLNEEVLKYDYLKNKGGSIIKLNHHLQILCKNRGITFVEINKIMSTPTGELKKELTIDGIHLKPEAYFLWAEYLNNNFLRTTY
ncbi:GDSL-type esterase/lipase family protein [Echinicola shivajiensis]|uniref:GDSL-type esterase/lipase family protein n=1 Tax=Echinicola shivajiensis TaxID=1035916 RepID=UPI001BFCB707|nr:GDSL-type esterase/lipase family protein [Echinicola shivajiensis]